jgi:hypothetical protein
MIRCNFLVHYRIYDIFKLWKFCILLVITSSTRAAAVTLIRETDGTGTAVAEPTISGTTTVVANRAEASSNVTSAIGTTAAATIAGRMNNASTATAGKSDEGILRRLLARITIGGTNSSEIMTAEANAGGICTKGLPGGGMTSAGTTAAATTATGIPLQVTTSRETTAVEKTAAKTTAARHTATGTTATGTTYIGTTAVRITAAGTITAVLTAGKKNNNSEV